MLVVVVVVRLALAAALKAPRAITGPWPSAYPAKDLCSNCGLCASDVGIASVTEACAFLGDGMSRGEALEPAVHGRGRRYDEDNLDEAHFGVHEEILLARGFERGAQWTGVATGVAVAALESGAVDAVVVAGSSADGGFGTPEPRLCRTSAPARETERREIPSTRAFPCAGPPRSARAGASSRVSARRSPSWMPSRAIPASSASSSAASDARCPLCVL